LALFSQHQLEILALLFTHPDEEYYLSEIGGILGKRPGIFQRGINALEKEGILQSRKRGNQRLFAINKEYVLLEEIQGIVKKTSGVEAILRNFAGSFPQIQIALIYGSYAKDKLRVDSDIDLLLVVSALSIEDAVLKKLSLIERKVQREINYKIYVSKEFKRKTSSQDPFLEEILSDKYILLKGKV
jgi:predicted nucleotidyltransferase